MNNAINFVIGAAGTVAYNECPRGWRIAAFEVPADIDSSDLTLALASDADTVADASKNWLPVYSANANVSAVNGAAFTAKSYRAVAEPLSRATEGQRVRLTVAAQTLAITIRGHLVRSDA